MDSLTYALLLIFGAGALIMYTVAIGLFAKPEWSLYGFVLVTFFFPNWATEYVGIAGVIPLYFFVEMACSATVLLAAHRAPRLANVPIEERRVQYVFLFMLAFHTLTYWPLRSIGFYPPIDADLTVTILYAFKAFCPAVFLYGAMRTIRTREQLTPLLWIFIICGTELFLEWFLIVDRQLLPGLTQYVMDDRGQFKSFTEMEPLSVGQFSAMAALSAACLGHRLRRVGLMLCAIPLMIPGLILYQRTLLVAIPASVALYAWLVSRGSRRVVIAVAALSIVSVGYLTEFDLEAVARRAFEGTWRDSGVDAITLDPYRMDQVLARNGIQARALDVFVYLFPFGTGEFDLRAFLPSEQIPSRFVPTDPLAAREYATAIRGLHSTETHNIFLEHVVSYGFCGVLSLCLFVWAIVRNAWPIPLEEGPRRMYAFAYSGLFFFAAFGMAYASPKGYALFLTLFHTTFLVQRKRASAVTSPGRRAGIAA
jgi:hypothetical protein